MLLFNRPQEPDDFKNDTKIISARKAVSIAISNGKKPKFPDHWKNYKNYFFQAQHSKCGYCEHFIVGDYGDVEHYRPKSEITVLGDDPKTWGREFKNMNNVNGRDFKPYRERGYYWLAYQWENYLLSCAMCNQPWKRSLFPIKEQLERPDPFDETFTETPYLLNPFGSEKPGNHLQFDEVGLITPKENSPYGFETIRTCGLHRQNLIKARKEKAQKVYLYLDQINKTENEEYIHFLLKEIYEMGKEEYQFAGMVRIIFEHETGITWEELMERV